MGEHVGLHSRGMLVLPQLSLMFTVEDKCDVLENNII